MFIGNGFQQGVLKSLKERRILLVENQRDKSEACGCLEVFFPIGGDQNTLDIVGDQFPKTFPVRRTIEQEQKRVGPDGNCQISSGLDDA
jgi:hypothetical protein